MSGRVASAIARVMGDDHFLETLILCPKNLKPVWEDSAHRYKLRAHRVIRYSGVRRDLHISCPTYRLVIFANPTISQTGRAAPIKRSEST